MEDVREIRKWREEEFYAIFPDAESPTMVMGEKDRYLLGSWWY